MEDDFERPKPVGVVQWVRPGHQGCVLHHLFSSSISYFHPPSSTKHLFLLGKGCGGWWRMGGGSSVGGGGCISAMACPRNLDLALLSWLGAQAWNYSRRKMLALTRPFSCSKAGQGANAHRAKRVRSFFITLISST